LFVVDTNILVYAAERTFPEHPRCRDRLLQWRQSKGAWYTTWGILYEFLRVTTHSRVFRKPWTVGKAWEFVEALLAAPALEILVETQRHASVVREVFEEIPDARGNLLHDAHTAILMKEHGVRRIYTRDTDFHRFPFLDVVDPLAKS